MTEDQLLEAYQAASIAEDKALREFSAARTTLHAARQRKERAWRAYEDHIGITAPEVGLGVRS